MILSRWIHFVPGLLLVSCGGKAEDTSSFGDGADPSPHPGPEAREGEDTGVVTRPVESDSTEPARTGGAAQNEPAGSGGGFGGSDEPEPPEVDPTLDAHAFCSEACASIEDESIASCASHFECVPEGPCFTAADEWSDEVREAYVYCLHNEPLCYQRSAECMLEQLYNFEEGVEFPVIIEGRDLLYPSGTEIQWNSNLDPVESGVIEDGMFTAMDVTSPNAGSELGPHIVLWLDANESGACELEEDVFEAFTTEFDGNFAAPTYVGTFTQADLKEAWWETLCERFE